MRCPGWILATSLAASSCLSVDWTRRRQFERPDPAAVEVLQPGESTLGECLAQLGAPLWVTEVSRTERALSWGYRDTLDVGVRLSIPLSRGPNPSFQIDRIDSDLEGLVLFFDRDWVLLRHRTGLLNEALVEGPERRRPLVQD